MSQSSLRVRKKIDAEDIHLVALRWRSSDKPQNADSAFVGDRLRALRGDS